MNIKSAVTWMVASWFVLAAASVAAAGTQSAPAHKPHVRLVAYFDAPVEGWGISYPILINNEGTIAGSYYDVNSVSHSFVRSTDGAFITIDPIGSTSSGVGGITDDGKIAGSFADAYCNWHGYLRSRSDRYSTFDGPQSGGACLYTAIAAINNSGVMVGTNTDANGVPYAYILARNGSVVDIRGPGNLGTYCFHLNDLGEAGCEYFDAIGAWHGLIHYPGGVNLPYDAPGAGTGYGQGTFTNSSQALNGRGDITGQVIDSKGVFRGYLRHANGSFMVFDAPGAGTLPQTGTWPSSVNDAGIIVGRTQDQQGIGHGFVRFANGQYVSFDAVGAGSAAAFQGTFPFTINSEGLIAGFYFDSNWVGHGFLIQADP